MSLNRDRLDPAMLNPDGISSELDSLSVALRSLKGDGSPKELHQLEIRAKNVIEALHRLAYPFLDQQRQTPMDTVNDPIRRPVWRALVSARIGYGELLARHLDPAAERFGDAFLTLHGGVAQ